MADDQTTGQSNAAADRSASLIRDVAQPADYRNRVWPVLTADDHLRNTLRSHALRKASAERRGAELVELPAEVMALEVVRLRGLLAERGGFW